MNGTISPQDIAEIKDCLKRIADAVEFVAMSAEPQFMPQGDYPRKFRAAIAERAARERAAAPKV